MYAVDHVAEPGREERMRAWPGSSGWSVGVALWLALAGCREASAPEGTAPGAAASGAAPSPAAMQDTPLGQLDIPDITLLNQRGESVRLRSLVEGKTVAMNFIFTRCTTICPPLGMGFGRLQKLLAERNEQDVALISVSLDPSYDTPERLEEWGKRFGAGPEWTRLTGPQRDVDTLLKVMGVYTPAREQHAPIVLVGSGETGQWVRVYGLSSPQQLLSAVDKMATRTARVEAKP